MDPNLTDAIAIGGKTNYELIISSVLTGSFALMGVLVAQYMQYRTEKRTIEEKEKDKLARLVNLQSLLSANKDFFKDQSNDVVEFYKLLERNHPKEGCRSRKITPSF